MSLYLFSQEKDFASFPKSDAKVRSFGTTKLGFKDQILFLLTIVPMPNALNGVFVTLLGVLVLKHLSFLLVPGLNFLGASVH